MRLISTSSRHNFGGSGKDCSQGDLNVDGVVNTLDFLLLASAFNKSLAAPPSALAVLVATSAAPNLFSAASIEKDRAGERLDASGIGLAGLAIASSCRN